MRILSALMALLLLLLVGCTGQPEGAEPTCGDLVAGKEVPYLQQIDSYVVQHPSSREFTHVLEPAQVELLQGALVSASAVEQTEWPNEADSMGLILWAAGGKWGVDWATGTEYLRLLHDGAEAKEAFLRLRPECLPSFVGAVSRGLGGACPVTPAAPRFADVAPARGVAPLWAIDGGGAWEAGKTGKVLWRFRGEEGTPTFTLTRTDGLQGANVKVGAAAWNEGHPDGFRSFPSHVTVPEPGCWGVSGKAGSSAGSITVAVR